jgi:hypothetical protein
MVEEEMAKEAGKKFGGESEGTQGKDDVGAGEATK